MTPNRLVALAGSAGLALLTIAALPAGAQTSAPMATPAKPGSAMNTETFTKTVAISNQFEIDSSKVALQKARAEDVKMFAQQMIDDHGKAGQDFQAALQKAGLTMPPSQEDPQHKATLDRIAKASNVDGEYVQAQVKAHQDAVKLFQAYANGGDNPPLKQFASDTLPTLQKHLQHVEQLARGQRQKTTAR